MTKFHAQPKAWLAALFVATTLLGGPALAGPTALPHLEAEPLPVMHVASASYLKHKLRKLKAKKARLIANVQAGVPAARFYLKQTEREIKQVLTELQAIQHAEDLESDRVRENSDRNDQIERNLAQAAEQARILNCSIIQLEGGNC